MRESEIIDAIETRVKSSRVVDYSSWTIGITDDPDRRRKEHADEGDNVQYWMHWKAESEAIARRVEKLFLGKGMKGGTGGGDNPIYVYIY